MDTYIQKYKHGDAIVRVLNVDNINRIIDVLVGLRGEGCQIEKPINAEGRNWKILYDLKHSDAPWPDGREDKGEDPKPLDYLVRIVADVPRESQYGDFAAQTDFNAVANASNEWLIATMLPLGYCYLTFTPSGGSTTTSARADGISSGFSLKAARKDGGELYRLAHGNQHAAMMREGDGNSIQIDIANYETGPAYILREWNTDNNYIAVSAQSITSGAYAFMHYDTYLTPGKKLVEEPHEIKFATLNKAFFDDIVLHVTEVLKDVIDQDLCGIVLSPILHVYMWHAMCRNYNNEGIPYAATPGDSDANNHGGWIHLDDIEGLADETDFAQLLQNVRALYQRVFNADSFKVEQNITEFTALNARIDSLIDEAEDYADDLAGWISRLNTALTNLHQLESDVSGLEGYASDLESRVEALKQALGRT